MYQARLPLIEIDTEKRERLDEKLGDAYQGIKARFKIFGFFQEVLTKPSSKLQSQHLKDEQEPEEFTKRSLIEPLIELLGFETISETVLVSPSGRREPDYVIRPKKQDAPIIYVEAEPINTDLYSKGHGISQVRDWLISRASKTDYGIATDGFLWILLKFDATSAQSKEILRVDLRPIFLRVLNPKAFINQEEAEKIEESFLIFDREYISKFVEGYLDYIEKEKEEISKRFYSDYVRYVFGFDEKGNTVKGICLLDKVVSPSETSSEKNLFSVVFMNRIIFTRFLEEKGIVPKNLLRRLLGKYKSSGTPGSFYETFLNPLFYEVFNKGKDSRTSRVKNNPLFSQIPYLNGGLFREVVQNERDFNIENEGIELVIENLIEKYSFGLDSGINPDILGYIFEKTINFISGTGTNQQKMKGAYYTPDDVVEFIIENTLIPTLFNKMTDGLRKSGWSETDLKGYNSIQDILSPEKMPKNPIHITRMIESIETTKVLDPACGSGHFLTAMLSQILRVKESLLRTIGKDVERYQLKREIISQNLFGVDIDDNAVEIARLRLWLSIIDEVENPQQIDTLPNIDFNIIAGNSLIGWLDEKLSIHPLINLLEDAYLQERLAVLAEFYEKEVKITKELLGKMKLKDTIEAYKMFLKMYSLESGERAVRIRQIIGKIREKLYEVISNSYLAFLHENGSLDKKEFDELGKKLSVRNPFHWKIDFEDVFAKGGFDIAVGNPPYIENGNYDDIDLKIIEVLKKTTKGKRKTRKPLFYNSKNCGNTHAYFTERSIKLLKQNGMFGFIVPISLVSTDRMDSVREFIHNNSSEVRYFNFDDRPGKIFSGLEHCRATIVITAKGTGVDQVFTSKYHRWYTENRSNLFTDLKTAVWEIKRPENIVPKIGSRIEKKILNKIKNKSLGKTVGDFTKDAGVEIWYHNAPQYWIHAHTENHLPKTEYFENYDEDKGRPYDLRETKVSSHYKSLVFDSESSSIVNGLLNSSLFYWWFIIWSDGRDLLAQHVKDFPTDLSDFPNELKKSLRPSVDELMHSYDKNSNTKVNMRSGGYVIRYTEIIPSKSKKIIDRIDDIFAAYYGFDSEERTFIKNFDIEFRT